MHNFAPKLCKWCTQKILMVYHVVPSNCDSCCRYTYRCPCSGHLDNPTSPHPPKAYLAFGASFVELHRIRTRQWPPKGPLSDNGLHPPNNIFYGEMMKNHWIRGCPNFKRNHVIIRWCCHGLILKYTEYMIATAIFFDSICFEKSIMFWYVFRSWGVLEDTKCPPKSKYLWL